MEQTTPGAGDPLGQGQNEQDSGPPTRYGRRALMLGAGAAGAGLAATLAGSADPAAAADDNPVELGESNTASASTVITTSGGNGLNGVTTSNEIYACGLLGQSTSGIGVYGTQSSTSGLLGVDANPESAAVLGDSGTSVGVLGLSSAAMGVQGGTSAKNQAGVFGEDLSSDGGFGVVAASINGTGVYGYITGDTTGKSALSGFDGSNGKGGGYGVYGFSQNGTGVYASGPVALAVDGVATFSRSGIATVAGTSTLSARTVKVTGVALSGSSLILATPQGTVSGVAVEGVKPDVSGKSFEITLTKAIKVTLDIAWFIVG